jgi:AraC-like DNA-binding protein
MTPTTLASAARVLWRLIARNGVDPLFVFRESGLDPAKMEDPRGRYPNHKGRAAWRLASRLIGNPCFGLQAADEWRSTDFHALGYAFLASRTLLTAIERIVRYNSVVDRIIAFEHTVEEHQVRLTYHVRDADVPEPPALQDGRWAVVLGLCRGACGTDFNPVEVRFTHPAPSCEGDYHGLFRCPVRFDEPLTEFVIDRAEAEAPLPAANRELAVANDEILSAYVAELKKSDSSDIVSRVEAAIVEHLPSGAPSAAVIAKDLFVSGRTLQRKLAESGTSYSETLETVRRRLAVEYITDPSRPLTEISFLLGFSELSAFSRAFRRWTGKAPSAGRGTV